MWMSEHNRAKIAQAVSKSVSCFGGGNDSDWNPIVKALKDKPPSFAAGVDVRKVVDLIVDCIPE